MEYAGKEGREGGACDDSLRDEKNSSYSLGMLCGLIGIMRPKCSEQLLAHSKCSIAVVVGPAVYYSYSHQYGLFINNNQALLLMLTIKIFTLIMSLGRGNSYLQVLDLLMILRVGQSRHSYRNEQLR